MSIEVPLQRAKLGQAPPEEGAAPPAEIEVTVFFKDFPSTIEEWKQLTWAGAYPNQLLFLNEKIPFIPEDDDMPKFEEDPLLLDVKSEPDEAAPKSEYSEEERVTVNMAVREIHNEARKVPKDHPLEHFIVLPFTFELLPDDAGSVVSQPLEDEDAPPVQPPVEGAPPPSSPEAVNFAEIVHTTST